MKERAKKKGLLLQTLMIDVVRLFEQGTRTLPPLPADVCTIIERHVRPWYACARCGLIQLTLEVVQGRCTMHVPLRFHASSSEHMCIDCAHAVAGFDVSEKKKCN